MERRVRVFLDLYNNKNKRVATVNVFDMTAKETYNMIDRLVNKQYKHWNITSVLVRDSEKNYFTLNY